MSWLLAVLYLHLLVTFSQFRSTAFLLVCHGEHFLVIEMLHYAELCPTEYFFARTVSFIMMIGYAKLRL